MATATNITKKRKVIFLHTISTNNSFPQIYLLVHP